MIELESNIVKLDEDLGYRTDIKMNGKEYHFLIGMYYDNTLINFMSELGENLFDEENSKHLDQLLIGARMMSKVLK